jgi:hypothetical protein
MAMPMAAKVVVPVATPATVLVAVKGLRTGVGDCASGSPSKDAGDGVGRVAGGDAAGDANGSEEADGILAEGG